MNNAKKKREIEKKEYQKIECIVKKSFDEVSKIVKKSDSDIPKIRIGTIIFS